MAKEYNSIYLGMVIDNNDPEFRGRVQVFIPHIMPTLYEGWNKEGKDITINCVGDNMPQGLTSEIVDKLKKILPWAEAASPIVGQSSPGGVFPAIAAAVAAVGEAVAGAVTATGEAVAGALTFDQSPTTIPAGNLPPGSELRIPTEPGVTINGLVPAFTQRLNGFYQEATSLGYKITCSSAFRSFDKQKDLWIKNGGSWPDTRTGGSKSVARPGGSSHEFGIAVDLKTTGNGVSITEIKTATDRTANRDTPAYRALLNKYGLHQPLHPDVYKSDVPEKWHVEPIEMPNFQKNRGGMAKIVAAQLGNSSQSPSELPSASQFPPNASPLTTKSPSNTDLTPPQSPATNTIPAVLTSA